MLTQKDIEKIKQTIVKKFNPKKVYLFGSYALGTPDSDSDLDLLIIDDTVDEKSAHRKGVEISLALFPRDYGLDLLLYPEAKFNQKVHEGWQFFANVTQKGKLLYERN